MKIKLMLVISIFTYGCVPVLIGTGAVAGYTLSNDAALGNVSMSHQELWDLSIEVLESENAENIEVDESKGIIKAKVSDTDIVVKISTIASNIQRLRISARKYFFPKPYMAQRIFFKITKELE